VAQKTTAIFFVLASWCEH